MKKIFYYLLIAVASVGFVSCSNNDPDPEPEPGPGPNKPDVPADFINSFFVLNRGSNAENGQKEGTLSYYTYSPLEGKLLSSALTSFKDVNDQWLGINPNAMAVYDKYLWVVINESNRIEVIDTDTRKSVKQISFNDQKFAYPRQIFIDADKAYITFSGDAAGQDAGGYIAQYNCKTYEMIQYLPVGSTANKPDGIVIVGEYIYCADNYGIKIDNGYENGNQVVRWLKNSDWMNKAESNLESLPLKDGVTPTDIVTNGTEIFVRCSGIDGQGIRKKPSMIYKINNYDTKPFCEGTLMKVDKNNLYVINAPENGLQKNITYKCYSVVDNNLVSDLLEPGEGVDFPKSLAVDDVTGDIIIGSATMVNGYESKTANGYFKLYSSKGKFILKGETGIDPFDILFLPKK